jgi:hypothetical protein
MRKLFLLLFGAAFLLSPPAGAFSNLAIYPQGFVSFPNVPVGSTGAVPQTISVYNETTTSATLSSVTLSLSVFKLVSGSTPVTLAPGQYANFVVSFSPTSAKSYTGSMTFNFTGLPSQKISLYGVGTSTAAIATLSANSLNFGSQALGSPATPKALTITNTGTTGFDVTDVVVTTPFAQTGFSGNSVTLKAGQSLTLQIYYYPWLLGNSVGSILIKYSDLNNAGVSLSGNASAAATFGIDTFPTLPSATQSAQYLGTLTSAGGVGKITWSMASGSNLPAGLVLGSSGLISGTLASSVAVGNYNFTVQATDSETPSVTATETLTLPVGAPTGSACNNVEIKNNGSPLVPLIDLGTGTYLGYEGGLYANGSNVDDPTHDAYGVGLAAGIQPLDGNGNPSPTGKEVLVTVGQSNTQGVSYEFEAIAGADPSVNPNLVIVNGASGGASGGNLEDPNNFYWTIITNNYLPNAGVTAKQVVAAWVNDVDAEGKPPTIARLQSELEFMTQNLLLKFPNIKIAYFSSVNYTGYSNGVINLYHEPNAYQAGFAVKLAIQDQLNGNTNLNFNPALGPVVAPWMAWSAYYWVDGLNTRSDGLAWSCQDSLNDGTHPSDPAGRVKASTYVLQFFKTDHTATPWFLAPTARAGK